MRIAPVIAAFVLFQGSILSARAAEDGKAGKSAAQRGPKLSQPDVKQWKIGMIVSASGGPVGRLTGTTTVPMKWPEQRLKLVSQDLSPGVTISYKSYGTATQMLVNVPRVADGKEAHAILTIEVTRHTLLPPDDTAVYVVPDAKALPPEFKQYLSPSPLVESNHPRIKAIAQQIESANKTNAWDRTHAIFDWVRKTIHYKKDSPLINCVEAIDKGTGDCNQLTAAFIAICRASGIPARTVQIPRHCYPEFYLEDEQGEGHWFPADGAFGSVLPPNSHMPILQKGDAFKIAVLGKRTETFRLLPSNLASPNLKTTGRPQLKLVCEPAVE